MAARRRGRAGAFWVAAVAWQAVETQSQSQAQRQAWHSRKTSPPLSPPVAPQAVRSSILPTSLEVVWPRGDDAVVEPTEWFEVQRRRLGDPDDDVHGWKTVENGDRVGSRYMAGIEGAFENGPHEAQVISVRVDRGQAVTEGYFQLAFNLGGVSYQERYTSAIYANNHTAAITKRIAWDATAAEVKSALEALESIGRVQVRRCDESGGLGGSGGWVGGCPYGRRGGYSWEVVFDPTYYESELGIDGTYYQPDGNHGFVDGEWRCWLALPLSGMEGKGGRLDCFGGRSPFFSSSRWLAGWLVG